MKKVLKIWIILTILWIFFVFWINIYVRNDTKDQIFESYEHINTWYDAVLVLGAGVRSGMIGDIFRDRLDTAIAIYKNWKANKILISADNSKKDYDEVRPARDYLLQRWIWSGDIFLDFAWFDTWDSLYRAKDIFGCQSLIISTQDFHLPRAVFIWNVLGMDIVGIQADLQKYVYIKNYILREKVAIVKTFGNIILQSKPKFLWEKIDIRGLWNSDL